MTHSNMNILKKAAEILGEEVGGDWKDNLTDLIHEIRGQEHDPEAVFDFHVEETIADIAYIAGQHNYYSGDSRSDMLEFAYLAKLFEFKFKDVDWEITDLDYMEEVEKFTKTNLRLVDKLNFTPQAAIDPWDNIEIEACRVIDKKGNVEPVYPANNPNADIERTFGEGDPDFYSVYLHQQEGGVQCIADVPTEQHANDLADLINRAVRSFKDNGFMALYDNKKLSETFNAYIETKIEQSYNDIDKFRLNEIKREFNSLVLKS